METFLVFLGVILTGAYVWGLLWNQRCKAVLQVVENLREHPVSIHSPGIFASGVRSKQEHDRVHSNRWMKVRRILAGISGILSLRYLLVGDLSLGTLPLFVVLGTSLGLLWYKFSFKSKAREQIRHLEFFLPIVMERISMAVQAGLDVLPALNAICAIEDERPSNEYQEEGGDPVLKLLFEVTSLVESGFTLDSALHEVAGRFSSTPLRHAFLHLAFAHREGGELALPLQELSDATQLYYQETVEEEIAKMPVKATGPLLLTFTGLIICFLTSPILQVVSLTSKEVMK